MCLCVLNKGMKKRCDGTLWSEATQPLALLGEANVPLNCAHFFFLHKMTAFTGLVFALPPPPPYPYLSLYLFILPV